MKKSLPTLLALFVLLSSVSDLRAETETDIQARMIERVSAVDQLKTSELVGENNRGFLEQRGRLDSEQSVIMADENADRRSLYGIIASRSGLSIGVVGEGRAEQIRNRSAKGVWLQGADGSWSLK
jgi:uncharacterized protein YdbL (DUF1318 family)